MNTTLLSGAALLVASVIALSACSMREQPVAGASGEEIYRVSACSTCHGDALEGTSIGPPLGGLSTVWKRTDLVEFLGEPELFLGQVERLIQLDSSFSATMPEYSNLSIEERDRLVGFLLGE